MTRWTEHVKGFAQEYGLSYGCAMTNALCKSSYREHYPKAAKEPKAKEPKAKAAKEPKEKKVRQKKVKEEQEIIFSQAAKDMMKGDIEFFTEMASSPAHLDALLNDPTVYYQGPEMKAFTRAAVIDNWAGQGQEMQLMAAEDHYEKNPRRVLVPGSQAFIPLEEAPVVKKKQPKLTPTKGKKVQSFVRMEEAIPTEIVSKNITIKKPKKIHSKPKPRKRVSAEEAAFEMIREQMPNVPNVRVPKKPSKKPKSKISQENYKRAVDLDELNKIEERKVAPAKPRTKSLPDFEGTVQEKVAKRKTATLKEMVAQRKKKPVSFIPMEEAFPTEIVSKKITITKPKPKKVRAPPKGTTKKQEEHDYNVSMFAQYFPEDEAFIEANVDKTNSQLKPLAVKYGVDPKEEFLFMALMKARKNNPTLKGKGIRGKGIAMARTEDAGGLAHIYPLSRGRILKLMRE